MPSGKKRIADLTVRQIRDEYSKTGNIKTTAKMFGLAETTIRQVISEKGAYTKKPNKH